MDIQTIDNEYGQLQQQSQATVQALQALGGKLQAASANGDQQAREWLLDLRELALSFRSEQDRMTNLLQALHGFVANQAGAAMQPPATGGSWGQQPFSAPGYPQGQAGYQPQPGYPSQNAAPQGAGGMLGGFLNSGFGRAIEMGAGFGIGDDLIKDIF